MDARRPEANKERPHADADRPARDVERDARDVQRDARDVQRDARDVHRDARDVERDARDVRRDAGDAERNARDVQRDAGDAQRYPADVPRPASHAARSRGLSARPIADAQCYPANAMDSGAGGPNDPRDVLRNDPSIAKKLLGYAYKKTQDITRAQDAAQEAVARVLQAKGWYAWKPDAKSLLDHLCDVVDTVVANESRRAGKRRERPIRSKDDKGNPGETDRAPAHSTRRQRERKMKYAAAKMQSPPQR